MRKLALKLDELRVSSFETAPAKDERATVQGYETGIDSCTSGWQLPRPPLKTMGSCFVC